MWLRGSFFCFFLPFYTWQCLHAQQLFVGRQQTIIKRFTSSTSFSSWRRLPSTILSACPAVPFRYAYTTVFDLYTCVCVNCVRVCVIPFYIEFFVAAGKTCSHAVLLNFPLARVVARFCCFSQLTHFKNA